MDVDAPTTPGVLVQDLALDITPLPADHIPKYLTEANNAFKDSRPPFVTTGRASEGSEKEVFVAENGKRPPLPIRANLVARKWTSFTYSGTYWTLDLNGERFIVQPFPNNGCVSGAKWVYCRWTGRGDDFEDQALAFTCINMEYTRGQAPKKESIAVGATPSRATTKDSKSTADVTNLPEDHPVEHLAEAEAFYVGSRPPFVVQQTKNPRRRIFLATEDGRFSANSKEAEVVYRAWNSMDDYATLDLDGKRFIVMGNAGGASGGYQYHLWLGTEVGRVKKTVAYCGLQCDGRRASSNLIKNLSEPDGNSSSSQFSENAEDQDSEVDTTEHERFSYNNFRKGFSLTTTPPSAPSMFHMRRSMTSTEPSAREGRTQKKSKPAKRARSPSSLAPFGSKNGKSPANVAKRTSRRSRRISEGSYDPSNGPYKSPAPTPSTNSDRPTQIPNPQIQATASLPTLTHYKQTHTTLRAARDSNIIGFVPLRLLACMTMSTLFSSVIAASGHREHEEPIKCLMAVFDWKDDHDVYKTIYVDKGTQGSFEIFLEIIDEAPCWKDEGGKCGIAIEIVRA